MYRLTALPTQFCFTSQLDFCKSNDGAEFRRNAARGVFPDNMFVRSLLEGCNRRRLFEECSRHIAQGMEIAIRDALEKRELITNDGWNRANHHNTRISLRITHEDLRPGVVLFCILNQCGYILSGLQVGDLIAGSLNADKKQECLLNLKKPYTLEFVFKNISS